MCTVIIHVPDTAGDPVRLIALRDEDPARSWDPLGPWWEDAPGVVGVRDRRAGGAWLAFDRDDHRLAVIMNRPEPPQHDEPLESRGAIVLDAVRGERLPAVPRTASFNLLETAPGVVRVTYWDNARLRVHDLEPGTHMIAHSDADDEATARIARWLPVFRDAVGGAAGHARADDAADHPGARRDASDADAAELDAHDSWRERWERVLAETTRLSPIDDEAIVRDNRPYGVETFTLYGVMVEVDASGIRAWHALLDEPAVWGDASFEPVPLG